MATTPDDTCLEHSLIFALIEIAEATGTRAGLKSRVPAIQRAALIALDQMEGGELKAADVLPFLSSTDPRLRDAARWIFRRHPEWAGDGAAFVREFLTKLSAAMPPDEEQNRLLQLLAVAPAVQIELARRFAVAPAADQASLLRVVVEARPKEFAPEWVATVRAALTNKEPSVVSAAVRAARALSPDVKKPNPEAVEFKPLLLELARDTARTRDIRLAAILAVAGPIEGLDAALLEFALSALDATNLPPVRAQALEVLQRAKLDTDALQRLADGLPRVGAIELPRLFALFEQSLDEAVGRKLLASLRQSTVAKSLPAASVRALFAKYPEAVQADAAVLIEGLDADAAKQAARFETLLADVKAQSSDIRRGQAIFNSPKTACATCHKIGYLGGTLGPDLTRISEVRSERDLLEAIVYPSASFVRSYEPVILITKSGEEHSGVLRKDAADEVVLGTGPDTEVRVARTEIGEMRPGNVSVMPQGLDEQLSRQELADLMAFLKNTRWGAQ
jgi:putative heme-binding domain-containing protein